MGKVPEPEMSRPESMSAKPQGKTTSDVISAEISSHCRKVGSHGPPTYRVSCMSRCDAPRLGFRSQINMPDKITLLTEKLLATEDPQEARAIATELQSLIRERIDHVRTQVEEEKARRK